MRLRTLGGLSVEGVTFRREKVLLLLAYLCVEGPQARRRLADLFWPDASNPMNSLAQHLVHLRSLPGALIEHSGRVTSGIRCDACLLREAVREGRPADAVQHYGGAFLDALTVPLGPDLEEWVYDTREALAREARGALITLSGNAAAHGHAPQAADLAARALQLDGAPPADELELPKLWHLLSLTGHPLAAQVEREARDLGLTLHAAPAAPATPFVGREAELETLAHLPPGQVAWVSGHAGMGKTALLEALARTGGWTALQGHPGAPYLTLEPLARTVPTTSAAALGALRDPHLRVAIDAWDTVDDATQHVIEEAARQRPGAAIVVTARLHPPFEVDVHLHLDVLSAADLHGYPGVYDLTEGHPTLVAAALRGQPLDVRQGARVRALPAQVRDTYLMLALQNPPDLRATRKATGLSADTFALTLSHLTQEGLTAEGGRVYAATAARDLLEQVPVHAKLLHLRLARALSGPAAWPHYDAARDLWEEPDEDGAARAAALRAADRLRRGFPGQAVEILDDFAERPDLAVPHAWALVGVGRYADALKRLDALDPRARQLQDSLAARATVLVRLGRDSEAVELARQITGSGAEAARAASVIAHAARSREDWEDARRHSQIAADLWRLQGEEEQYVTELGLVALARSYVDATPDEAFRDVLPRAEQFLNVRGAILLNYAKRLGEVGLPERAGTILERASTDLERSGDVLGFAQSLINSGVLLHLDGQLTEAAGKYRQAIEQLRGTGSVRTMGMALSNLSEIESDLSAFEDVLGMLLRADQIDLVMQIRRSARLADVSQEQALQS
ncbi:ATP-binding protein [Deinococcus sp.]|uniref:ATP-binding protein n=1 Tax=Deinococcus sp. TaxID=47478 RepID=UPI002869B2D9|nr:ATP-binding protein [Deinococcus sp.]